MTDDTMALRSLLQKPSDGDLLREMIGFAADRVIELEMAGLTGPYHGERCESRINPRNGYRKRDWQTHAGTVELRVPRLPWRLNGEIKPRTDVVGIFANEATITRLIGAISLEQSEEGAT